MQITTVGLDLAKNEVHGVNRHGKVELRRQLKRDQVASRRSCRCTVCAKGS